MTKITFIGAGSTVFAKNLMGDILSRRRRQAQALKHYELAAEAPKVSRRHKRRLLKKIRATKRKLR